MIIESNFNKLNPLKNSNLWAIQAYLRSGLGEQPQVATPNWASLDNFSTRSNPPKLHPFIHSCYDKHFNITSSFSKYSNQLKPILIYFTQLGILTYLLPHIGKEQLKVPRFHFPKRPQDNTPFHKRSQNATRKRC